MEHAPTPTPADGPSAIGRRRLLGLAGAAGLALVAAACGGSSTDGTAGRTRPAPTGAPGTSGPTPTTGAAAVADCVLMPEMTEGPYYLTGEPERRDVTEGTPGDPLQLRLTVVDVASCRPIPGAVVEIWHADAQGAYSGFGAGASSRTFLRGSQPTGADGVAVFDTVYPGWYPGRTVHIHVKVRPDRSSRTVHTGQLFFDDTDTDAVMTHGAYARSGSRTRNAQDGIYRGGGAQSTLTITSTGTGDGTRHVGTIALGIANSV